MAMETFIRKELKYKMTDRQKAMFLKRLESILKPDHFFESTIYSIYLDTENFDLMRLCLDRPAFRQKVRIRSYAPITRAEGEVFLELKKKVNGFGLKSRCAFTPGKLEDFFRRPQGTDQASKEMAALLGRLSLEPKFSLQAHRFSYVYPANEEEIRITIDDRLTFRTDHPGLYASSQDEELLEEGWNILEIKCSRSLPLPLVRTLFDLSIAPVSFSKAGQVYARILERKSDDYRTAHFDTVPADAAGFYSRNVWCTGLPHRL